MPLRRTKSVIVPFLAAIVSFSFGCSSDDPTTPNTNGLTASDKAAITSALAQSGALSVSPLGGFAFLVVEGLTSLGTLNAAPAAGVRTAVDEALRLGVAGSLGASYEQAFGAAVGFDITAEGERIVGYLTGVVGWNGLNTSAGTVDELVTAILLGIGTATPPASGSGAIQDALAYASYFDGTNAFFGGDGIVTITSSSFSGSTGDCGAPVQGYTISCSYTAGTMSGEFDFTALGQTGNYTQSGIVYTSLPAVRVNIVITQN